MTGDAKGRSRIVRVSDNVNFFSNVARDANFNFVLEISEAPEHDAAILTAFIDAAREGVIQAVSESLTHVPGTVRIALTYRDATGPQPWYDEVTSEARTQTIQRYGAKDEKPALKQGRSSKAEVGEFRRLFWDAMQQDPPNHDRVRRYLDALDREMVPTGLIDRWVAVARRAIFRVKQAEARVESLENLYNAPIVPRADWGAKSPIKTRGWDEYPPGKPLPLTRIVVHHTAGALGSQRRTAKDLQDQEIGAGYADLPYHFIVSWDGTIYEGREIGVVGAHAGEVKGNKDITKDPDWGSIGIVVMGNFDHPKLAKNEYPTSQQMDSLQRLLNYLTLKFRIDPSQILKDNEVIRGGDATVCPGRELSPLVDDARNMSLRACAEFDAATRELQAAWAELELLKAESVP